MIIVTAGSPSQNVQALGAGGLYGTYTVFGGGGTITARDALDYLRQGSPARTPDAEYPDGYLGTSTGSRREDRLLAKTKGLNNRSYTRGVHRGERVDPGDYLWPAEWNPKRGLMFEAKGMKTPLAATAPPPVLVNDGKSAPPPVQAQQAVDPNKRRQMSFLMPPWS